MPDNNQQKMLENNVTVLSEDNLISHLQNRKAVWIIFLVFHLRPKQIHLTFLRKPTLSSMHAVEMI